MAFILFRELEETILNCPFLSFSTIKHCAALGHLKTLMQINAPMHSAEISECLAHRQDDGVGLRTQKSCSTFKYLGPVLST